MEEEIGSITHFYDNLGVAIVNLNKPVHKGDKIHIKGKTTDLTQILDSMELDHKAIEEAKKGAEIGIKVQEKVREHDKVFRV